MGATEGVLAHETRTLHLPTELSKRDCSDDTVTLYKLEDEAAHLILSQ